MAAVSVTGAAFVCKEEAARWRQRRAGSARGRCSGRCQYGRVMAMAAVSVTGAAFVCKEEAARWRQRRAGSARGRCSGCCKFEFAGCECISVCLCVEGKVVNWDHCSTGAARGRGSGRCECVPLAGGVPITCLLHSCSFPVTVPRILSCYPLTSQGRNYPLSMPLVGGVPITCSAEPNATASFDLVPLYFHHYTDRPADPGEMQGAIRGQSCHRGGRKGGGEGQEEGRTGEAGEGRARGRMVRGGESKVLGVEGTSEEGEV